MGRNQMVEEKMYSQAETYLIEQDLFVEWLLKEVTNIADHHEEIGYIKENYEETIQNYIWEYEDDEDAREEMEEEIHDMQMEMDEKVQIEERQIAKIFQVTIREGIKKELYS